VPDYFYFDKTGYSGWSELADVYDYDVDVDAIRPEVEKIANYYISNNISRFEQTDKGNIPDKPYVVVFEQREDDAVSIFANVHDIAEKVKVAYKDTKYEVVVRPHPLDLEYIKGVGWRWSVNVESVALHDIIANSSAVYTVNSSAGFEALLHKKRVFTAGHCDFHWATDLINDEADIKQSIGLLDEPVDENRITKFLHYCFTQHFMNVNDRASIERKIQRAVDHYESIRRNG
jgi:capsule polysaccharide export protein KpsC/LpsZ